MQESVRERETYARGALLALVGWLTEEAYSIEIAVG